MSQGKTVDVSAPQIQEMVLNGYLELATRNGHVVYVLSEKGRAEVQRLAAERRRLEAEDEHWRRP